MDIVFNSSLNLSLSKSDVIASIMNGLIGFKSNPIEVIPSFKLSNIEVALPQNGSKNTPPFGV
jgi:hypothetical protein